MGAGLASLSSNQSFIFQTLSLYIACSPWGGWLGLPCMASGDSKRTKGLRLLKAKAQLCSTAFAIFCLPKKLTLEDGYTKGMKSKRSSSVGAIFVTINLSYLEECFYHFITVDANKKLYIFSPSVTIQNQLTIPTRSSPPIKPQKKFNEPAWIKYRKNPLSEWYLANSWLINFKSQLKVKNHKTNCTQSYTFCFNLKWANMHSFINILMSDQGLFSKSPLLRIHIIFLV